LQRCPSDADDDLRARVQAACVTTLAVTERLHPEAVPS
jgi:hypothetical protein